MFWYNRNKCLKKICLKDKILAREMQYKLKNKYINSKNINKVYVEVLTHPVIGV